MGVEESVREWRIVYPSFGSSDPFEGGDWGGEERGRIISFEGELL